MDSTFVRGLEGDTNLKSNRDASPFTQLEGDVQAWAASEIKTSRNNLTFVGIFIEIVCAPP
jgi:hypothetical protein